MLFQKTLTKATVELVPNQSIEDGFQLLVGLAEIHVPRMWVEKKTGNLDHQVMNIQLFSLTMSPCRRHD